MLRFPLASPFMVVSVLKSGSNYYSREFKN